MPELHGRRLAIVFVTLGLIGLWRPTPVWACTPPPGGLPTFSTAEYVNAAPLVVEGTVAAVSNDNYQRTAVILATQYIKGIGPQYLAVSGYGPSSVCLSDVYNGQVGLFLIQGDTAGGYRAVYLSQFDAILPDDTQTREAAIAASGQTPRTDFTPYQLGTPDAVMTQAQAELFQQPTLLPFDTPYPDPTLTPTPTPAQIVSSLDTVSVAGFLIMGACLGLLAGAGLGFGLSQWLMRRK